MTISQTIAQLLGFELVSRKRHPTLGSHLRQVLSRYAVDLVLDVGANTGRFGQQLRSEAYTGEIHSFEPVSHVFDRLQRVSRHDLSWCAHKLALGDAPGRQSINITAASDFSSFLEPNSFGAVQYTRELALSNRETVDVSTIDDFLADHITNVADRRIFLKMDTQGYDLKVFDGARRSLPHIVCLLSELSLVPIYEGMPHYRDALKQYEDHGFAVTGIFPVSRNTDMTILEMDCVLINTAARP